MYNVNNQYIFTKHCFIYIVQHNNVVFNDILL